MSYDQRGERYKIFWDIQNIRFLLSEPFKKTKSFVVEFSETFQPSKFPSNEVTKYKSWQSQVPMDIWLTTIIWLKKIFFLTFSSETFLNSLKLQFEMNITYSFEMNFLLIKTNKKTAPLCSRFWISYQYYKNK